MVSKDEEKNGGPLNPNITFSFNSTLSDCNVFDLGFVGPIETFIDNQQGNNFIAARLDRFLSTNDWKKMYPYHKNTHLPKSKSGHNPIMLEFLKEITKRKHGKISPKRFENIWLENPEIHEIVRQS